MTLAFCSAKFSTILLEELPAKTLDKMLLSYLNGLKSEGILQALECTKINNIPHRGSWKHRGKILCCPMNTGNDSFL